MWTNIRLATLQDRIDSFSRLPDAAEARWTVDYKHAFHTATVGGAEALGLAREVGCFEVGMRWDALLLDCRLQDMAFECPLREYDVVDAFERVVNCGDDRYALPPNGSRW